MTKDWRSRNPMADRAAMGLGYLVAVLIMAWAAWGALQEHAAASWPVAPGRLVSSEVHARESRGRRTSATKYWVEAKYEYTVAGRTFTGDRVGLRDLVSYRSQEQNALLKAIRAAEPLGVRYRPGHPEEAVLVAGQMRGPATWLTMALVLVVFLMVVAMLERIAQEGAARRRPRRWRRWRLSLIAMLAFGAWWVARELMTEFAGDPGQAMARSVVSGQ